MELMIGEKIKKYRRDRDMTQDQLAQALGVSPQSVSKWECADGYPDITLLPRIANYFGVTIDLLLGNDKASRAEDTAYFFKMIREELPDDAMEERLRLGIEYAEKYPERDDIAHELCWIISLMDKPRRGELMPVMREMCEKIIRESTEQVYRENAIMWMCTLGTDADWEKWSSMCAHGYNAYKGEVLESRLLEQERYDECVLRKGANKLELFCHLMHSNCGNWNDPEKSIAWCRYRIDLMKSFGDGIIPPAWQGWYGINLIYIASHLFQLGCKEEGYRMLDDAYEQLAQWTAIPDGTALDVGHEWLFHGITTLKNEWNFRLTDGKEEYSNYMYITVDQRDFMYRAMSMKQNWPGFDSVRDEPRFKEYLAKAKALAES